MSNDVNRLFISGRLVKDIELRECPGGKPVADFILASNRKHLPKDDPERSKYATFIKVTLWNQDAEFWGGKSHVEPLYKGDEVLVEGQLFGDDFIPKEGMKTSGRIRIDNAHVKLLRRKVNYEE